MASASSDKTVIIWSPETSQELQTFRGHQGAVTCVAYSPDGTTLASGDADGVTKVWAGETGREMHTLTVPHDPSRSNGSQPVDVCAVAFSPDGKTLASATEESMTLWEVSTGEKLRRFSENKTDALTFSSRKQANSIAFSPDGKILANFDGRRHVMLWSVDTGEKLTFPIRAVEEPSASSSRSLGGRGVAFSPDGKLLASITGDSRSRSAVELRSVETGQQVRVLRPTRGRINNLAFSPDGNTFASGSLDRTVKLWSVESGRERLTFSGHAEDPSRAVVGGDTRDAVNILDFSPNGKTLASGTVDLVMLCSTDKGEVLRTLSPLQQRISGIVPSWLTGAIYSPDGQTLAAAAYDGRLILWDPSNGLQRHSWVLHGRTNLLGFSRDGWLLATANANGTCYLLRVPPHAP